MKQAADIPGKRVSVGQVQEGQSQYILPPTMLDTLSISLTIE